MAIESKTLRDIQFTRNVLETLGEWQRALKMARVMISRFSARHDGQDTVNAYREILVAAMACGGFSRAERAAELDSLFTGYLTVRDHGSAAEVLMRTVDLWRRGHGEEEGGGYDWAAAFAAACKCISLFSGSNDPKIVEQVRAAFSFRWEFTPEEDPDLIPECSEFGRWLEGAPIEGSDATEIIVEFKDAIPSEDWIKIAESFLETKRDDLDSEDITELQLQIMWSREALREFDEVLNLGFAMLKVGFGRSEYRARTLLTLGTSFIEIEQPETAGMFLRQVVAMYPSGSDNWVPKMARESLERIDVLRVGASIEDEDVEGNAVGAHAAEEL